MDREHRTPTPDASSASPADVLLEPGDLLARWGIGKTRFYEIKRELVLPAIPQVGKFNLAAVQTWETVESLRPCFPGEAVSVTVSACGAVSVTVTPPPLASPVPLQDPTAPRTPGRKPKKGTS